jgi:hypothetical protein
MNEIEFERKFMPSAEELHEIMENGKFELRFYFQYYVDLPGRVHSVYSMSRQTFKDFAHRHMWGLSAIETLVSGETELFFMQGFLSIENEPTKKVQIIFWSSKDANYAKEVIS